MHDLQGVDVPGAVAGAIAKAITGAYLSSGGNAFSTRTASMIVQEHFPPSAAARGLESGPLFGVQFSQLPCSDLVGAVQRHRRGRQLHRPEALAARPRPPIPAASRSTRTAWWSAASASWPTASTASIPRSSTSTPTTRRAIALAASTRLRGADEIRAERITVDGTLLRFTDATEANLLSNPGAAPGFAAINGTAGALTSVARLLRRRERRARRPRLRHRSLRRAAVDRGRILQPRRLRADQRRRRQPLPDPRRHRRRADRGRGARACSRRRSG